MDEGVVRVHCGGRKEGLIREECAIERSLSFQYIRRRQCLPRSNPDEVAKQVVQLWKNIIKKLDPLLYELLVEPLPFLQSSYRSADEEADCGDGNRCENGNHEL